MQMPSPLTMLIGVLLGLALAQVSMMYGMMGFSTITSKAACGDKDKDTLDHCKCYNKDTNLLFKVFTCIVIGVALAWAAPMILKSFKKGEGERQLSPMSP